MRAIGKVDSRSPVLVEGGRTTGVQSSVEVQQPAAVGSRIEVV
jgi:hypothetical protein